MRWDENDDRYQDATHWRGYESVCETPGCDEPQTSTDVFCSTCLAKAQERVRLQRERELQERRTA